MAIISPSQIVTAKQVINCVKFTKLKNLKDLEITFEGGNLFGILGPNGCGKSTVIHALACMYKPQNELAINYKFSQFFTPTNDASWSGSEFTLTHSYKQGAYDYNRVNVTYSKQSDRWVPKYDRRPERYVSFIGIKTTVPAIENETQQTRIQYNTQPLIDSQSNQVRAIASLVMNKDYQTFNKHTSGRNKEYIGVSSLGINYSSLSMGAGEQRVFYILGEVIKSPNYGLIIIDEIDLLLHKRALKNLLEQLNIIAIQKNLQIIFTTHNHSILDLDFIHFKHLLQTPEKTICLTDTKPDAIHRLTGEQERPIEFFVEDPLSRVIIKKKAGELGMSKYVSIKEFGPADNCFGSVAGAILNRVQNLDNILFVLDGDRYRTEDEKKKRIKKVITGDVNPFPDLRDVALTKISQFILPEGRKPEEYYHKCIIGIETEVTSEEHEIIEVLRQIVTTNNSHAFFEDAIIRLDLSKEVGLDKLVSLLSKTQDWEIIVKPITDYLQSKKSLVVE